MANNPTKQHQNWQADMDLHHLIQAAKIHKDKKRHGAAMKVHKQKLAELKAINPRGQQADQETGSPIDNMLDQQGYGEPAGDMQ